MSSTQELVITAMGPDRPGIVAELTGFVHAAGANLADSRMAHLRGTFALLALVEGTADVLADVEKRVRDAAEKMNVRIEVSRPPKSGAVTGVPFRLKTYSMDQPGIVHKVTSFLRQHNINVEDLDTHLESAPFMGTPVFTMELLMTVPRETSMKALRKSIEELGDTLNCDIDLDPA